MEAVVHTEVEGLTVAGHMEGEAFGAAKAEFAVVASRAAPAEAATHAVAEPKLVVVQVLKEVVLRMFGPPSMTANGIRSATAGAPDTLLPQPQRAGGAVRLSRRTRISWLVTREFPMAHGIRLPGREARLGSLAERAAEPRSLTAALALAAKAGEAVLEGTAGAAAGVGAV